MTALKYAGAELEVFRLAVNWKQYWAKQISPYITGRVLEVGAGNGNNTELLHALCEGNFHHWTCLEPDSELAGQLQFQPFASKPAARIKIIQGTTAALPQLPSYDTILYIDVLEHIQNDAAELQVAAKLLTTGGYLVVLSPAHRFLYTAFDRRIGHFRRYSISTLRQLTPGDCRPVLARYADSAGMLVSLANRLLLRQPLPTSRQIKIWDRLFIPVSRLLDLVTLGKLGKSVLVVWEKVAPLEPGQEFS